MSADLLLPPAGSGGKCWQDIWVRYNEFEEYTYYDRTLTVGQFVGEWERRLGRTVAAGCRYTDTVLALKLLAGTQLPEEIVAEILGCLGESAMNGGGSNGGGGAGRWELFERVRHLILDIGARHLAQEQQQLLAQEEEDDSVEYGYEQPSADYGDNATAVDTEEKDTAAASLDLVKTELDDGDDHKDEELASSLQWRQQEESTEVATGAEKPHACDLCGKRFKTKHYLKEHRVMHTNERPFRCDLCAEAFNFRSNLRKHRAKAHTNAMEDGDGGEFSEEPTNLVLRITADAADDGDGGKKKTFKCVQNGGSKKRRFRPILPRPSLLHPFLMVAAANSGLNGEGGQNGGDITADKDGGSWQEAEQTALDMSGYNQHQIHKCEDCDITFSRAAELRLHMADSHMSGADPLNPDGSNPLECDICQKMFQKPYLLRQHRERHLGLKSHLCTLCNKFFSSKSNLRKHQRLTHTDPNAPPPSLDHKCEWCGKGFARPDLLKDHTRIHINRDAFVCPECGKTFSVKSNLKKHVLQLHATLRPFKCAQCSKSFVDARRLETHMRYHEDKKKRPFPCPHCSRAYMDVSSLQKHLRTIHEPGGEEACLAILPQVAAAHGDQEEPLLVSGEQGGQFQCESCPKSFAEPDQLERHRKFHTGERPHVCDLCPRAFYTRVGLRKHRAIHSTTGEQQQEQPYYACPHCHKPFNKATNLWRHVQKMHGDILDGGGANTSDFNAVVAAV